MTVYRVGALRLAKEVFHKLEVFPSDPQLLFSASVVPTIDMVGASEEYFSEVVSLADVSGAGLFNTSLIVPATELWIVYGAVFYCAPAPTPNHYWGLALYANGGFVAGDASLKTVSTDTGKSIPNVYGAMLPPSSQIGVNCLVFGSVEKVIYLRIYGKKVYVGEQ